MVTDESGTRATFADDLPRLFQHLPPRHRRQLVLVLLVMVLGAIAEVATLGAVLPFLSLIADPKLAHTFPLLQEVFWVLGWRNPDNIVFPATILFASVALTAGAIRLAFVWISQKYLLRLAHVLAIEVYRRTLHQPYSYHVATNSSEVIATINKVQPVALGVLQPLMNALSGLVTSAFVLVGLLLINASVAICVAVGFGAVYLLITAITRSQLAANSKIIAETHVTRLRAAQEGLGGIRDVLLNRTQPVYVNKFRQADRALADAIIVNAFISVAPRYVIEAVGMMAIAVLTLMLSQGPNGLTVALPTLGALALGAVRLLPLVQLIYFGWSQASGNRQLLTDVLAYLDLPVRGQSEQARGVSPLPFHREVALKNLSFQFEENAIVLKNINLTIAKGERVALVGETGSGKSTLMDLVMGLLVPTSGAIIIDGKPLTLETLEAWQAQIAHVPQFIYLADASIAENIAFAVAPEDIDWSAVRTAARRAQIAEFVESLPSGYETHVGEQGVRLSGGQRQRIAIARALYHEASFLVLDEATSALDNETESAVMASINNLDRDLTIFIIAHRLSTIEACDSVYRLSGGKLTLERSRSNQILKRVAINGIQGFPNQLRPASPSVQADGGENEPTTPHGVA